ncbi:flavin oxidoreductase/NADH oxidase [Caproiciproducens sp. NJN-50]|uniref:oxidoreductase n=1 Tax=Caproiciproducens sp. NJN-50 TaxID=2507162 RepID=UPI000FFE2DBD|nr:flavin oxidoreductase/NADH oxidase [Caproiciproducens sp. NJN-50]QAT48787.1 flavin oxidoreductase/NADH oxidase [Caproiciproducens sp. NJN-50]
MKHRTFHYRSLEELRQTCEALDLSLPFCEDLSVLKSPCRFGNVVLPNRLGIAPMEGADSDPDGAPTGLTYRRYRREAEGGAALIWMEAVAVVPEGRSSPKQLMLTPKTLSSFQRLVEQIREAGMKRNGYAPYLVMQANHSGRYAKPNGAPQPMIAYHHPVYERQKKLDDGCIVSDDYLRSLEEKFGEAAFLCKQAGFDAMDVKSCHGYLFAELASAYVRKGAYGGPFENRFRLLFHSVRNAKQAEDQGFLITSRVGIYDGFAYPYGFGMAGDGSLSPDYREAVKLVGVLSGELGLPMVNITMGNPYQNTHVTRPYDRGKYIPAEHPLEGIARMIGGTAEIKKAYPSLAVAASAPSYLRQYAAEYSAGAVAENRCDLMCFGRMAFANPGFPNQILKEGRLDAKKVCVTCGKCGDLIRAGLPAGCVVRDPSEYLKYYLRYQTEAK